MKKRTNKLLSLLLTLVMVLGMLPAMSVTASAAVITDVNFTVRSPIGTEHPSNTATCDNDKVRVTDVQWTKGETGTGSVLDEDDEFKAGEWYTVKVYFSCSDNYTVAVNYTATLNGNAVNLGNADGMPGIYVTEYVFQAKDSLYAYLPDDVSWTIWGNVTASGETGYNQLKEYIQQETVTWAIRLDSDVKYTEDYKLGMTVTGKKYLDLNGHDIDIKYDKGWTDILFTIPEGSELVILDSKGGGSIRYDGYIFDGADYGSGHLAVRHVFDVSGKLTINGGRILGGGRSKKQWLANAREDGNPCTIWEMYNGYVRNQVNGYGVIVRDGGELTVNGGDVTGRGFLSLSERGSGTRACAIKGYSGSTITLNDGYFKGYGCADVLQIENGCDLTIKAGVFDTHKIDKVRLPNVYDKENHGDNGDGAIWLKQNSNYTDGTYGDIGIPKGCIVENAEVIVGGETQEADEDGNISVDSTSKKTFISPQETIPSLTSYIRPVTGVTLYDSTTSDTGNTYRGAWTMGTAGILEAVFDENDYYWEQGILDNDCMGDTRQKSYMVWEIRDYFQDKLLATIVKKSGTTLNLNALSDVNGDPINIQWETGRIYSVTAYMAEEWDGHYEYETLHRIGQYDIQALSGNVGALGNADIVDITQEGAITSYGSHYPDFTATVSQNTIDVLEAMKDEGEIVDWYVTVSYDEAVDTVTYPVTHKLTADTSAQIYTGAPGITTVESKVYVGYASSATHVVHSQKVDLLAFSDIAPTDNFTWNSTEVPIITLTNYEDPDAYIRLDAGFGEMENWGRNVHGGEILTGQTLDASNIYWEYQDDNGNWVKIESPKAGMVYGSERGETNNYLYVRADATYRACYPIGDKVFTSPKPMVVRSPAEYDDFPLNLIPSTDSTTYGGGATISADLTPVAGQSSEWSNDLNAVFQCISWPDGAKIPQKKISYQPSNASSAYNQYFTNNGLTVQTDAFFRGSESNVYPGTYTYRVTVYDEKTGRPQPGGIVLGQERRTSFDVSITYEYTAAGADIYIDGENISNQPDDGCYLMPGNTNEITLETRLYPIYATKMPSGTRAYSVNWEIVGGEYVGEIVGQGTAATFTAKQPGKATVRATIKDGGTNDVFTTVYVDIIVPIAGFTVEKPELVVGDYVSSVLPTITSVWSYGGEKITNNIWAYLKVNHFTGSTGKVAINTSYNAIYQFIPQGDNRFPVVEINDATYGTIYEPDMSAISMNTFDTLAVSSDAGRGYSKGDTIVYVPEEAWIYYDYTYEWVRDPNAKYVDFISVTQTTPAVGDTAVYDAGTDWNTIKFLAGEVSFGAAPFDYSSSVYPITDLLGSGIPYDDASANYNQKTKTTDVRWNADAASYEWYGSSGGTERSYYEGIHMNELNVYTADGADGTTYYFSPDVMLVVNGHQVKVNVNTGTRIGSYYYFDVGTVDVYDGVTVLGIKAPVGGETPATADQTRCISYDGVDELPLYVSRLTWFIDADGDNVCDEGEEALVWYDAEGNYDAAASGLNEDGTFKYNTTYKVSLSVALDEGATGRLAPYIFKTSVYTGTVYEDASAHYDTSGAPTDAVYAFAETGAEPLTKYEASFTAGEGTGSTAFAFDPIPVTATHNFSVSSYYYADANGDTLAGGSTLEAGKSYTFHVTFAADTANGYSFPENFAVIIDGKTLTSGVTISGIGEYLSIAYPFTLGGGSGTDVKVITVGDIPYTVSGNVVTTTSAKACKLGYLGMDGNYVAIVATENTDGSHSFTAPDGVTEVLLVVKGDVNCDGNVNSGDYGRLNAVLLGKITITNQASFAADVNDDGNLNSGDYGRVNAVLLGKTKLSW